MSLLWRCTWWVFDSARAHGTGASNVSGQIYRKLNGHDLPSRLPPELIPPSTKKLADSVNTVKGFLAKGRESPSGGVSYMKSRSFHGDGSQGLRKDGTAYKFNDDASAGYKSSARHRARGVSPSPASASPSPGPEEMSLDQLRKKVKEKRILLDAIDIRDEARSEDDEALDRRDRRDVDDLYRRIRRIQEDIDSHPNAGLRTNDADAERRQMKRQLQNLTDRLPDIASKVRSTERRIADAKMELFRIRDAREHPESASLIVGTGPGGAVTESDRRKAKSRAMMQQHLAALTGKPVESTAHDGAEAASKRLADESQKVSSEKADNERMTRDVEDSVGEFRRTLEDSLNDVGGKRNDGASEHERRRWEDGLGVEDEVKDFIFDLQRQSRSAALRRQDDRDSRHRDDRPERPASTRPYGQERGISSPPRPATTAPTPAATAPAGGTYSQFSSAQERAAYIKQQGEQRMAERLAALGIKHPMAVNLGESAQQRAEREQKEREERIRRADEDEAQREQLRQARLQGDIPAPPPSVPAKKGSKAPPPPPSRKNEVQDRAKTEDDRRKAEEEAELQREQGAMAAERQALE